MKYDNVTKKIDSLPPLPKTVIELEEFKKSGSSDPLVLLNIIEKDPLIVSSLLKVSNSAMFGFRSSVETPSRALSLLGVNFTLSIAFSSAIKNSITSSLIAYGITTDDFMKISNLSSKIVNDWFAPIDYNLKEELLLPAFLQETGKFIISDVLVEEGKAEEFLAEIKTTDDIASVEEKFIGTTTSKITAQIFRHWNLSETLINSIEFVDFPDKAQMKKKNSQILHIAKTIANVLEPLSEKSIKDGLLKCQKYGFDCAKLEKAIEKIKDRLEEEGGI